MRESIEEEGEDKRRNRGGEITQVIAFKNCKVY